MVPSRVGFCERLKKVLVLQNAYPLSQIEAYCALKQAFGTAVQRNAA